MLARRRARTGLRLGPLVLLALALACSLSGSDDDPDQDGVARASDNCAEVANADQADWDGNGVGDACDDVDFDGTPDAEDNCLDTPNASQSDLDADGQGDACDDSDADGVDDASDNCPLVANATQDDLDSDGTGDACDDRDADGLLDVDDNCPWFPNASQADLDGDLLGDVCDDSDGDGVVDSTDNCPLVANATQADFDSDGSGDACDDADADGRADAFDNCPLTPNPDQANTVWETAAGDACSDYDADGVLDAIDICSRVADADQADADGDGWGNACDANDDNDLLADADDNCPLIENDAQFDLDRDGVGDVCDADVDGDGAPDASDPCPFRPAGVARGGGGDGCGTFLVGQTGGHVEMLSHRDEILYKLPFLDRRFAGLVEAATGVRRQILLPSAIDPLGSFAVGPGDEILLQGADQALEREVLLSVSASPPPAAQGIAESEPGQSIRFDLGVPVSPDGQRVLHRSGPDRLATALDGSGSEVIVSGGYEFAISRDWSVATHLWREGTDDDYQWWVDKIDPEGLEPPGPASFVNPNVLPLDMQILEPPGESPHVVYQTFEAAPLPGESTRRGEEIHSRDLTAPPTILSTNPPIEIALPMVLHQGEAGPSIDAWHASPDGSRIVVYDCDNGILTAISTTKKHPPRQVALEPLASVCRADYAFLPDASAIVYRERDFGPGGTGEWRLQYWELDGSAPRTLASGPIRSFEVLPDSSGVVFSSDPSQKDPATRGPDVGLFAVDVSGDDLRRLVDRVVHPRFEISPDGATIAFQANWSEDRLDPAFHIYAYDVERGTIARLTPDDYATFLIAPSLRFSPSGNFLLFPGKDGHWSAWID